MWRTWTCLTRRPRTTRALLVSVRSFDRSFIYCFYVFLYLGFFFFFSSVEDKKEKAPPPIVSKSTSAIAAKSPTLAPPTKTTSEPAAVQTTSSSAVTSPTTTLSPAPLNLANVDLGKISSILNSITNAMKNTGEQNKNETSLNNYFLLLV